MKVLVDTSIWSLALRRKPHQLNAEQQRLKEAFAKLISEHRVVMIGPVRQELLSGLRSERTFKVLKQALRAFDDAPLKTEDFEEAARAYNQCRASGVSATPIDLLMCAVAQRLSVAIFTTDKDFSRYAKLLPIRLYNVSAGLTEQ